MLTIVQKNKDYPGEIQVNWKYQDKKRKLGSTVSKLVLPTVSLPELTPTATGLESGSVSARDSPARDRSLSPKRKRDRSDSSAPLSAPPSSRKNNKECKSDRSDRDRQDRGSDRSDRAEKGERGSERGRPDKEKSKPAEPPKPRTLEDVYEVGEELGSGAFSIVKAGKHKTNGKPVAIKILDNYGNLEDGMTITILFLE